MDKEEFMQKLIKMYPSRFAGGTGAEWIAEYKEALKANFTIDFDKLWEILRNEYGYSTTPQPSWLREQLTRCPMYESDKGKTYLDIEIIRNGYPYLFAATFDDLEYLRKKGINYKQVSDFYSMGVNCGTN